MRPRAGADVRRVQTSLPPVTPDPKPVAELPKPSPKPDIARPKPKDTSKPRKPVTTKPALPRTAKSAVLRRQMVEHAKVYKKKKKRARRKHILGFIICLTVLVSLGILTWAFQDLLPFNLRFFEQQNPTQATDNQNQSESSLLDETPITANNIAAHTMGKDEPRVLRIPALDIEARVKRVGVSLNSEPIAPSNIYDVGWFEQNGKPKDVGAILLNGHMVGPTKNGIFANLKKLQPGNDVLLELGDGSVVTYKVSKVLEYPLNQLDMGAATTSINPSKKGLNIMTTSNRYSTRSEISRKQLIVFTIQQ